LLISKSNQNKSNKIYQQQTKVQYNNEKKTLQLVSHGVRKIPQKTLIPLFPPKNKKTTISSNRYRRRKHSIGK